MGEEAVSLYLWSKFRSILEEVEADSGSQSLIVSRFRSIAQKNESSPVPTDGLYKLIQALSDFRVFTYQRRSPRKVFYFHALINLSEFIFNRRMKKRLIDIEEKLKPPPTGGSRPPAGRDQYCPFPHPQSILGFEEKTKLIEARLMTSDQPRIGIVGRCGCGKTSLAHKVFASPTVVEEFSPRIWVRLSNVMDLDHSDWADRVLRPMLSKTESDPPCSLVEMLDKLRDSLEGKRYLIVLDDLSRNSDNAKSLYQCLPKGSGGAVIVTSRREDVIRDIVGVGDEHVIELERDLRDDICWQIFSTAVQEQVGHDIINKKLLSQIENDAKRIFDDLPLAAKFLANVLRHSLVNRQPEKVDGGKQSTSDPSSSNISTKIDSPTKVETNTDCGREPTKSQAKKWFCFMQSPNAES